MNRERGREGSLCLLQEVGEGKSSVQLSPQASGGNRLLLRDLSHCQLTRPGPPTPTCWRPVCLTQSRFIYSSSPAKTTFTATPRWVLDQLTGPLSQSKRHTNSTFTLGYLVFLVVMYGWESWTIKETEHRIVMLLNCGGGKDS